MSVFEALLRLQELDTAADRLRHRRANLAERAELVAGRARAHELGARADEARARRDAVLDRQSRLEATVAGLDRRIAEIDSRLYSGEVTATRDLMAMSAEIDSLKARRSRTEDEVLAAMEECEPLLEEVAALELEEEAAAAGVARLAGVVAEAEAAVDAELAEEERARSDQAAALPDELLATYERLRARLGGVGAARLAGASCSGCHLTLPAQELARIKREPPDALVLCDQCGRILVR